MQDVFIVCRQPHIVLLRLDLSQNLKRIGRLESNLLSFSHTQIVHASLVRLLHGIELRSDSLFDIAPFYFLVDVFLFRVVQNESILAALLLSQL